MDDEGNCVRGRNWKKGIREYEFRECSMVLCGWGDGTKIGETMGIVLDEEFFL